MRYAAAVAVVFFLLVIPEARSSVTLLWEDCVKSATQNNAELQAAKENLRSTEYLSNGAWSGFLPQITTDIGYNHAKSTSGSTESVASTYSASVSASQNLFAGFQDNAKINQTGANEDISRASFETTKAKVSFDLKSAFENLVYAQEYLRLAGQIITRREENMQMVQLRFESGRENKGSAMLAKANLEQAKLDELQARNSIRVAQEQLAKVIGMDDFSEITVKGAVPVSDPVPNLDLKRLAVETPDHRKAVFQEDAARASLMSARSSFFPSLDLTGQVGRQGDNFFPQDNRWSVGLNLSFPLFRGGKDYYNTKSASALLTASSYNRENVDRDLLVKLRDAYTSFEEAVVKLKVDEYFYQASTARAQIGREKYNNGLLSFDDWDILETDLIVREKNQIQSQRDRIISEATWEQALGRGVIP